METVELPGLVMRRVSVGELDNNVYLLTAWTGEQLLIDAADEPEALERLLESARADAGQPELRYVVTTHSHHDHLAALAEFARAHPAAEILAGDADADAITVATRVPIGRRLQHGDVIKLGAVEVNVIGLRGHTPGSLALACSRPGTAAHLFTGDSLFPRGLGRTETRQDFDTLFADVVARIFAVYPDDTIVWPGHGGPTVLEVERPQLEQWRERGW